MAPRSLYSPTRPQVLLWPIGLPVLMFFKMFVVRHLIAEEDDDTLLAFSFILGDYKTTHWCVSDTILLSRFVRLLGLWSAKYHTLEFS
jgi:hypothetical protein